MKVVNFALFHPPHTISAQPTQASFSYSYSPWECYKTSFSSSKHTRKMKGKPLLNAIVRLSPESSQCSQRRPVCVDQEEFYQDPGFTVSEGSVSSVMIFL